MVSKTKHYEKSNCPVSCALDIIGDHWTLLIIYQLMFKGHHEFKDILNSGEGISTNILSNRLKKLREEGIIESIPHPESKRRKLYYLTESGKDLLDIILSAAKWSEKHLPERVDVDEECNQFLNMTHQEIKDYIHNLLNEWEAEFLKN